MAKKIDIDSLAKAIYQGQVTPRNLPEVVYHFNAEKIVDGIYKGYGKTLNDTTFNSPDYKMLNSLRENAYMFSGAKTFQQTLQMTEAMTDGDKVLSFEDFKSKVEDLNIKFNESYLQSEYDTAIASSQNASSWERFEQDADVLPYLTYQTIGDACEICLPLDGITLPVSDEFWNKFYPPNHFNCLCLCLNSDDDSNLTNKGVRDRELTRLNDLVSDTFQMNSGKSGEVFDKDHPYFLVPAEYKEFAKDNFGLEIPEAEVGTEAPQTIEGLYPNINYEIQGNKELIEKFEQENKIIEHLQSAGIPKDITGDILITYKKDLLLKRVEIEFNGSGIKMTREINLNNKIITNEYFKIDNNSSYKGRGAEIFKDQVDNATKFGFKRIETYGAGEKNGIYNGYYTWGRLGYEPKVGQFHVEKALETFNNQNASNANFMEMMSTKKGQDFWKENGRGTDYKFDLTKDSPNQIRLQNYIDGKGKK